MGFCLFLTLVGCELQIHGVLKRLEEEQGQGEQVWVPSIRSSLQCPGLLTFQFTDPLCGGVEALLVTSILIHPAIYLS